MMRQRPIQILGALIAIASLVGAFFAVKAEDTTTRQKAELSAYVRCQAAVDDQLIKALQARTAAADAYNATLTNLIVSLFDSKSPEQAHAVFLAWQMQLAKTAADRAAHPLPSPPSRACGTTPG
jgi:hypothetical protein